MRSWLIIAIVTVIGISLCYGLAILVMGHAAWCFWLERIVNAALVVRMSREIDGLRKQAGSDLLVKPDLSSFLITICPAILRLDLILNGVEFDDANFEFHWESSRSYELIRQLRKLRSRRSPSPDPRCLMAGNPLNGIHPARTA